MSRIIVIVDGTDSKARIVKKVKDLTRLNSAQILTAISNKSPVIDFDMSTLGDKDVTRVYNFFRTLQIDEEDRFSLYNIITSENFDVLSERDKSIRFIEPERLFNIFDSYSKIMKEIH